MRNPNRDIQPLCNLKRIGVHAVHMRVHNVVPRGDCALYTGTIAERIVSSVGHMPDLRAERKGLRFPRARFRSVHEKIHRNFASVEPRGIIKHPACNAAAVQRPTADKKHANRSHTFASPQSSA
jgi:hypothetical protein